MIKKADRIITFDKLENHRDAQSATLAVVENRSNGRKINVRKPTFDYGRREEFSPPEYNLMEIGVIEDVESYVRQAFQKKTALMFKEGHELTGKNKETIDYLKKRFQQIEHVSSICWNDLLRQTGYALLSRSNFFWVKVRNPKASGGRIIAGVPPVAAYFPMGAENVEVKKNKSGKIIKYRQVMPDGRIREFSPRDVIHFHAYRKTGFAFGTPQIVPCKEDIRALRRIEENVELLIYQTLFPIFQYKVGTENRPATDIRLSDGTIQSEVDFVKCQIQDMPSEGGIVTPERHEINFIGAEGKALKAREYLDYFKQRVFTGLGVSGVDLGEGETANRATADTLSRTMVDSVKDYQDILAEFLNKEVIKELLMESAFNFDILDSSNIAEFKFREIDIEEQLKKNTNAQVLYNGDIIDIDEARAIAGQEPLTEEQEEKMYSSRVTMKVQGQTLDAQMETAKISAAATAARAASSSSSGSGAAAAKAKNSNSPTNQHGTKTGPQKSRLDHYNIKDGHIANVTRMLKNDISKHVKNQIIDSNWINTLIKMGKEEALKKYLQIDRKEFVQGLKDANTSPDDIEGLIISDFQVVKDTTTHYINKYMKDINGRVQNAIDSLVWEGRSRKDIQDAVNEVFQNIKYRGDFIDATERMRAYNYGKAVGLRHQGFIVAEVIKDSNCESCEEAPDEVNLQALNIFDVPPFHPNSSATIGNPR
jgi:hypothetical protein